MSMIPGSPDPQFTFLNVDNRGPVCVVTMDRPPVNAVSQAMYLEIREFFSRVDELLPEVRAIVLTGEGKHFSAGNDLDEFLTLEPANSPGRMKTVRDAFFAIYDAPVPVIGAVKGAAAGTGVAIAASCDVLVCGESARLSVPEVGVGVMGGGKHLQRLVPEQVMRLMYFTAEPISAEDLLPYGGIYKVVPDERVLDEALALSERMTVHSRAALRHAKEALNAVEFMDLKTGYETEQRYTARLSGHPDSHEARAAVRERRPPSYENS
jgi:enoyl-CoA hydratase/carnithine racemase